MWPPRISDRHFKGCLEEATTCLSPQFLFSPLWLPPVSSQALFPVTISWWFCSPYLPSSEPESTDLSVWPVQSSEHCEDCPFWLLRARDDEYLVLSEELFTPAPLLPPTPCAPAAGPDLDIHRCMGAAACLFLTRPAPTLSHSPGPAQFPSGDLPGSIS